MRAPPELSTLYLRDGRALRVPDDRIVEMSEGDAKAVEFSGRWSRVGFEEGILQ
jgi:hypothetical protein